MSLELKPWEDVPPCRRCGGPVILAENHPRAAEIRESLICMACGHTYNGTPAEVEQARRADEAWEKHGAEAWNRRTPTTNQETKGTEG